MRQFNSVVLVLSMLLLPVVLHAEHHGNQADEGDHLSMYRQYEGKWESLTKTTITSGEEPVEFETKGHWVQKDILAGGMIEVKGLGEMDGKPYEYMLHYGHDL